MRNEIEVRQIVIDGVEWFVARDVCALGEVAWTNSSLDRIPSSEKSTHVFHTPAGPMVMAIVSEVGAAQLLTGCPSAMAGPFRDWLIERTPDEIVEIVGRGLKRRQRANGFVH